MHTYLVTLGKGLKGPARMNGALFLGEKALYFLCASLGVTGWAKSKGIHTTGL